MGSRTIEVPGGAGGSLAARLDLPADEAPRAYAVFAHCFTCSKDLTPVARIAQAMAGEGVAVLRCDFTGHGESEGELADTTFTSSVDDLVAVADWLAREHEPPAILIGHSLGGAAAIRAASRIASVRAVATIGAPFSPRHAVRLFGNARERILAEGEGPVVINGRTLTVSRALIEDLEEARIDDALRTLDAALLIAHSPRDEVVEIENATRLFTAARHPKSFLSLGDADHLLTDRADARYVGAVIAAWSSRFLDAPAPETLDELRSHPARVAARTGKGFRTEIVADGHPLVADEPAAVGGTEEGPTPYDLLVAGLGACTGMTLRMYADRKQWPLEEVIVRLTHRKVHALDEAQVDGATPQRLDRIERELELLGPLDSDQRERLRGIADRCPVHRTLEAGVDLSTTLRPVSPD